MALDKLTKLTSNSGISTVIDYTMSDLVVDSINIAGGGTTLGKDFETRNLKVTGLSTFVGNVQMDGNLTVNGTTTTLDTNLIGVDRVEVVANDNNYAGIAVTQSGTGDIISAYDGSTAVFLVNDGNKVGIADSIYHIGDDNTAFGFPAADTFKIDTAGVERLRIDSSGRALVGHNASLDQNAQLQSFTTGTDTFAGFKYGNNAAPNIIRLGKSRNASAGGNTIVADDDEIGRLLFSGNDGSSFKDAAYISGFVDGTPSTGNDMPGRLSFFTSPDGSLPSLERLRITSGGQVGIGITNPEAYEGNGNNLVVGNTTSHNGITILTGTDKDGRLGFADGTGVASYRGMIEYQHGTGAAEFMKIVVAGDEMFRIASDGKIGIGTQSPDASLEIFKGSEGIYLKIGGDDSKNGRALTFTSSQGNTGSNGALHTISATSGNGVIALDTAGTERLRITNTGRIYIGTISSGTYDGIQPQIQLEGTDYNTSSMSLFCNSNTQNNAPQLQLGKSRSGSDGGTTALANGDRVGSIYGIAADGSDRNSSVASIQFYVDGTVGTDTTPGSIRFATTATQSGSNTPTERLRIDSDGRLLVNQAVANTAFTGGDDLIIGNTANGTRSGLTLVSASNTDGGIYFSDGSGSATQGQLVYSHTHEYFAIYTGATGIRLKIDGLGGHNFYNNNSYAAANLAECNADKVAINIRQTRQGQTKGIAIGAIGTNTQTGLQAYDSSNNSANNFNINPFGGNLGIGLGSGNDPNELLHIRSATTTAPLIEIEHNTGGTAYKGQIGMRGNDLEIRGSSGQMEFYTGNIDGASSTERFRIKDDGKIGIHDGVHIPLTQLHILDYSHSSWDAALNKSRSVLRLETDWNAGGHQRAIGDYGSGIVFNHLGGHSTTHNDDSHAWLGLRVWDTPGYERSALVFATNDQTGSESNHDAGLKERMSITPHGHVVINNPTNNQMTSSSHAKLWVEADGISTAEWDPGDNQGPQPHLTLAGQNSHVRLDMGTMDVNPYGGYIQARFDNTPDLGATDNNDGLEPLMLQPRGGPVTFNFGKTTTMPANFDSDSPYGLIRMRAGRANSTSINDDCTAIKIWPAETRVHAGQKGEQDQGTKYGGISWLVMDGQSNSGWAAYDGNQCWMGMSLHSTPGQELGNWQLRMNNSGNQNSVANNIALQASPQGWVTKPSLPAFHVGSPNVAGGSSGAAWRCHANSLWLNRGSHYDNSNGRFTAPINGLYYFFFWGMSSSSHNGTVDVYSRLDGSRDQIGTAYESNGNSSGGYHQFTAQFVRPLNKNQYVDIYTSQGSLYNGTDGRHGGWGGWLIG